MEPAESGQECFPMLQNNTHLQRNLMSSKCVFFISVPWSTGECSLTICSRLYFVSSLGNLFSSIFFSYSFFSLHLKRVSGYIFFFCFVLLDNESIALFFPESSTILSFILVSLLIFLPYLLIIEKNESLFKLLFVQVCIFSTVACSTYPCSDWDILKLSLHFW